MNPDKMSFDEKIKKLVENLPEHKPSEAKRREFIARLYKVGEERRRVADFVPGFKVPVFASAAILAVLIVAFGFLFSPIYPVVDNVKGTVKIYRASSNTWVFAEGNKRIRLAKNDILKTFSDGQADLSIPNVYHIRLKKDSEIRLARSISMAGPGNIGYVLEKGRTLVYFNKYRKIGKELAIETPQAVATALGTDFMVASAPLLNQTTVGVLDGAVKVNSTGEGGMAEEIRRAVLVKAGETTTVRRGEAPAKPVPMPEDELLNMGELYSIGIRPQVALLISTGPTRTRELLSLTPLYISSERSGILAEKFEPITKEINAAIRQRSKEMHIDSIEKLKSLLREYPNPKYDVQFMLFIGAYYKHIGEYEKAIAAFEQVVRSYPNSSLASLAQCAIGIIYEEKIKDLDKAKSAYSKVLSDYPQSPEAEEATAGLNRLPR